MSDINILADGLKFPEGPLFLPDGSLWGVELKGGGLFTITKPQTGKNSYKRIPSGGSPNGLAWCNDEIWVCDAENNSVRSYNPESNTWITRADSGNGEKLGMPNDLAFDNKGNMVFTCPNNGRTEASGFVCALSAKSILQGNKDSTRISEKLFFANGLAFTQDFKKLIIAETYKHRLLIGDWNSETLEWSNRQVYAKVGGPIGPDGFAFDEEGFLYVAVYESGLIKVVDPNGNIDRTYSLPGSNPTNCAFDPSGSLGLVVTETEKGLLLSLPINKKGIM